MESEKPSFARFGGQSSFGLSERMNIGVQRSMPSEKGTLAGGSQSKKTMAVFDWIITGVLMLMFFGVPIFFTGVTFQGIAFEKQIFFYFCLLIGLVAWASKGIMLGDMQIRRTPLDIPILLFWAFYVITVVFSVDRWHSFWGFFGDPSRGFISITALVLSYFFILSHFDVRRFYLMFSSFLVSGSLVVVWSFLVMMKIKFLPTAWEQYAPLSSIGTISTLTLFLALFLPLLVTGIFILWREGTANKTLSRNVLTGLLGLILVLDLFLLLALYSYVSWAVVLGGLGFFLIYILAQIIRPAGEWTWVPMVLFVVVLSFLMIGQNKLVRATLPIEVMPNFKLSWEVAKEALKDNFLIGSGAATYGYNFSLYRPQEFNSNALYTLRFYQGTGLVAEALPTIGIIGTVLMLVIWFSFLSIGLYLLTLDKQKNKIISLGFWSVSVMLFIAGFVAPINGTILILGVLLASLALGVIFWESGSEERWLKLSFKATPKFALALAFIFMVVSAGVAFLFVFVGKVFVADLVAGQAARMAPTADGSIPKFVRAIQLYPREGRYFTRIAQEHMALANEEGRKPLGEREVERIAFHVREAVALGERSKQIMPNDVLAVEALGLIYENASLFATDALPKAEQMYARASELEPQNPLFYIKLGQIKRLSGDDKEATSPERKTLFGEARDFFQQAIDKKPNLAVAHYNMAVALARLGETESALKSAEEANRLDRNNLAYQYNLGSLYQIRKGEGDLTRAETVYKNILDKNERLIDVRLSLGLLYESQGKRDAALSEYERILTHLSNQENQTEAIKQTRTQINTMIENLRSGKGNISQENMPRANGVPEPVPSTPSPTAPADNQGESLLNLPAGPRPIPNP